MLSCISSSQRGYSKRISKGWSPDANRFSLKAADAAFMKTVASRINIVPIIAKADGLSPQDMHAFKERVRSTASFHGPMGRR